VSRQLPNDGLTPDQSSRLVAALTVALIRYRTQGYSGGDAVRSAMADEGITLTQDQHQQAVMTVVRAAFSGAA
jgi:hypothetical protein